MPNKRCFLAMPIGTDGTPDHAHFRALYDEIIKPAIEGLGYTVSRSDDVQKTGAITKDIILHLAEADIVIVDLTTMNPNVFYELGVRHCLRGQGTVMIVDEQRTDNIPFDLSAYRVIKFRGDLPGFGKLRRELLAFAQQLRTDEPSRRDNPVHDCLPSLPLNAIEAATGSTEGLLRAQVAGLERRVAEYKDRYGDPTGPGADGASPLSVVMTALEEANEGNLPSDLLSDAETAAAARDTKGFLGIVRRILERRTLRLSPRQFIELADLSLRFGVRDVTDAILIYARKAHPKNGDLRTRHLATLAHSEDLAVRERARREIVAELGITQTDGKANLPEKFTAEKEFLFSMLMDTYSDCTAAESAEILILAEAAVARFPNRTRFVRNKARALEEAGKDDEALDWYQRAVWCADVDDTAAVWLGNEFHNRKRHADALEAYLLACVLDPDDANGFAHVADEIAWAIRPGRPGASSVASEARRPLPDGVGVSTLLQASAAALSCHQINEEHHQRLGRATKRLQIKPVDIESPGMSLDERVNLAFALYERFKSSVTMAPQGPDSEGEG